MISLVGDHTGASRLGTVLDYKEEHPRRLKSRRETLAPGGAF